MTETRFTICSSTVVPLFADHVDTDQIIPARFLKGTQREGMGEHLFADWRRDPRFVLNRSEFQGSRILLAGDNFGCGSSREHAAWALVSWGFRVVVARSFAEIFRSNALKNGLLPVQLMDGPYQAVKELVQKHPGAQLKVDLEKISVTLPDGRSFGFRVDAFARQCLLDGIDQLDYLLRFEGEIRAFEVSRA